ncbi:helix-turn-helix domain-containing protein [Citricoccus sp. NR2]|uniref:helix-turn-helix domain-containing protein n=1 Tax=Citricoccus sp. NR2 TaxID=3004095 RepID=UPI0022DD3251|nr:helix-turn-helix transcriptional regulator [Citricoccus sp. NR2]WBL18760.1 helix-turn-helix transcriptional regulator [Citricoccus sp. NR2]
MSYIRQLRANIVAELSKNEMSQTEAGRLLGLPQASFAGRLKGRTPFRIHELLILAHALDVSVDALLHGVEEEWQADQTDDLAVS